MTNCLVGRFIPPAPFALCLQALSVVLACCFLWKRKSQDVLPEYLVEVEIPALRRMEIYRCTLPRSGARRRR